MKKWLSLGFSLLIGTGLWFLPEPSGVSSQAWHLFAIFVSTIIGIILKPFPMGPIAFLGLTITIMTHTLPFHDAFSGFSHDVIWLIVFAIFVSRGFIKTGLGARISYFFMMLLGKRTLGLGYGMAFTDLLLAPAIPSSTARTGGIVFPIVTSVSQAFGSTPHHPSAHRIGNFLTNVSFQASCITSAMFLTGMAANPLIAKMAQEEGIPLTWGNWFLAACVPGIVSLLLLPLLIYKLTPPGIKETPNAAELAKEKLREMGRITLHEWTMLGTFVLLILLWIKGPIFGISPTLTALIGLVILLLTETLHWKDILHEYGAWETLVWFSILFMMATQLNHLGLTSWFAQWVVQQIHGLDWTWGFVVLSLVYFYAHYFFASNVAHVGAMFLSFLAVAVAIGTPPFLAVLVLGFFSSLFGGLTHYGSGPAAVLFGAGFVSLPTWWKVGAIVSVVNIVIWIVVGSFWWRIIGFWS